MDIDLIKYKAWNKKEKCLFQVTEMNFESNGRLYSVSPDQGDTWYLVEEEVEILRYTGLDDKTGKPIYEGDILEVYNQSESELHFKGIVIWCDKYAKFVLKLNDYDEPGCVPYVDFWEICDCSYNIYIKGNKFKGD